MVSLEWFLSPDLYSKPIDKHIYINNKTKQATLNLQNIYTLLTWYPSAPNLFNRWGIFPTTAGEKILRKCRYSIKEVENQDLKTQRSVFLTTEKLTKSVTVFLICSVIPEDYQLSIKYYIKKRQKSSQCSSRSFHSLLTIWNVFWLLISKVLESYS